MTSPTYAAIKTEFNALPRALVYNPCFSNKPGFSLKHREQLLWTEFLNPCSLVNWYLWSGISKSMPEVYLYYCRARRWIAVAVKLCKLLGQCTKIPIEPVSKRRKLESDREREQNRLEFISSLPPLPLPPAWRLPPLPF